MANGLVNLPNNIYNGGAVKVDSSPFTNFYLQSQAKKRAKDEALDNYFRDFNKNINPAGMRTQDIEGGWLSKVNDWQSYYQQNKDLIEHPIKDNGKAYNQYLSMHNDLLADTEKSKNLSEKSKQYVVPIVSDPNKRTRLRDNAINAIHQHDLSMYDKSHVDLDPSIIDYSAKQFDIADQKKLDDLAHKNIKMSSVITNTSVDPHTKQTKTTYSYSYSPDDIKTIGGNYADAYSSDQQSSFGNFIDDIAEDETKVSNYNELFKKFYGRDMQDNADLAAAYGLHRTQTQMQQQKATGFNPYSPYDYLATGKLLYDYKKEGDQDKINNTIDDLVNGQKHSASAWNGYEVQVDPATLEFLNVDKIIYNPDSNTFIGTWTDQDGNEHTNPMTEDSYKSALGKRNVGEKYFKKTTPKKQTTEIKIYKYNGKEISSDAIQKAAQQSGMTVDEYIKEAGIK